MNWFPVSLDDIMYRILAIGMCKYKIFVNLILRPGFSAEIQEHFSSCIKKTILHATFIVFNGEFI